MEKKYNEIKPKDNMVLDKNTEEHVEKRPMAQVTTAKPAKKKGLIGRLIGGVMGPDGAAGLGQYIVEDIVTPAIKNLVVDSVTSGINKLMYGDRGGGYPRNGGYGYHRSGYSNGPGGYSRTNYTSRYTQHNQEPAREQRSPRRGSGLEDYVIDDRVDAANVLTTLTESADMYGSVTVADYYDMIGAPTVYTDHQHGWTIDSIMRAVIVPSGRGFVIKFPQPEVI